MSDFLFRGDLSELDPELRRLADLEAERQYRHLILIPSESSAPHAVRQALASAFQNLYAEGYPNEYTRDLDEAEILNLAARLAYYRRYSDPRYYKGTEYADVIEALARRRCAEAFATSEIDADKIFVNVQALSGAPANNAVYHALVEPGDTVMGMSLIHGGHLTHGSPVNRSGQYYHATHYTVDPESEMLDYDAVAAQVKKHKPKLIIAGYTSYPWAADWLRFREIADSVGAYLLADIAHVAGLVVAGIYPSPIGIADVVSFTTHKSLCGPRGAAILTTSPKLSRAIDRAVFPGEQGGPHMATILAQALTFKLARTERFKKLQEQIVANCVALTEGLEKGGLRIPYGGTNTHLTNIDCKSVVGEDGTTLSGDMAARILDLAGIVANRNTIPGDVSAGRASGVRLGTPWITQRGFTEKESRQLGALMAELLKACTPYQIEGRRRPLLRAKVDFEALNETRIKVRELAMSAGIDFEPTQHGYPHFYYLDDPEPKTAYAQLELEGTAAAAVLRWVTNARPLDLKPGETAAVILHALDENVEAALERGEAGELWRLTVPGKGANRIATWLRDLSDGFIPLDANDLLKKSPGPFVVRLLEGPESLPKTSTQMDGADKPWDLFLEGQRDETLPDFEFLSEQNDERRTTALHAVHKSLGAKMVPFAGWDMPVWYTSVLEEHRATRQAAGLFDVSHMGVYQIEGPQAAAFLDSVVANDVASLAVGRSLYTHFLDPDAQVIDDLMIYRRREAVYLLVVNAGNDDKDWTWLNAVKQGGVAIDRARPWAKVFGRDCTLRNLRRPEEGADMLVDIALQGPQSRKILLALGCDPQTADQLKNLPWTGLMEGSFGGFDLVVSRTGYTGERIAFELFVHPQKSVDLWKTLLEVGEPLGIKPVGLGARDSLRIETGLPLYGHELAGELRLGIGASGFASYVKTYKPWFIGRSAFLAQEAERDSEVARFRFDSKRVRVPHYGDPVVDRQGQMIGSVTSCAMDSEGYLLGQAFLQKEFLSEGTPIAVYQGTAKEAQTLPVDLSAVGKKTEPTPATVLSRFR
jgi:glycine hydroxymethyltransferase